MTMTNTIINIQNLLFIKVFESNQPLCDVLVIQGLMKLVVLYRNLEIVSNGSYDATSLDLYLIFGVNGKEACLVADAEI